MSKVNGQWVVDEEEVRARTGARWE